VADTVFRSVRFHNSSLFRSFDLSQARQFWADSSCWGILHVLHAGNAVGYAP
jgi:hypothetical protein